MATDLAAPILSVVVSVYKEEGNIPEFPARTIPILTTLSPAFEIIFAMDPLPDLTEQVVLQARAAETWIKKLIAATGYRVINRFMGSLCIGFNGIICFSRAPLILSSILGLVLTAFSFLGLSVFGALKLSGFSTGGSFPALAALVTFLGGVQLLSVGILGEYIGRIYDEVKQRPKFVVDAAYGFDHD